MLECLTRVFVLLLLLNVDIGIFEATFDSITLSFF